MSTSSKPDESRRGSSNKDGDWICPDADCKNLNFARRSQCNRCGGDRPYGSEKSSSSSTGTNNDSLPSTGSKKKVGIEIGKVAAEKSRGLFSAEDWQCSKCANVNWARRHTCNLCNAPRFCEVEERTGYGGGYNDRGVVEYKDRSESDDEYDEFGRRKKKRSDSNSRFRSISENISKKLYKKSRNDEEEDDDDDDDSGDLSKYDLWGSDTEDNRKNVKQSETKPRKRKQTLSSRSSSSYSRSRSRSPRHSDYSRNRQDHYRCKRSRSRSNSPRNKHHSSSYYRR
ncbi:zinc finger Ran-binding domain-containing protein 2 isoform X2 [Ochlerotatus camptorhynchus]|uniref:zinc finger Ran-binding domain-containing protein 2 isoform X2 n=1 Tax=Ochlerotatus camptorhynchus TaxID=644619 RepID=UPI0031D08A82